MSQGSSLEILRTWTLGTPWDTLVPGILLATHELYLFYHVLIQGGEAPLYNYVIKYKALLVVDVVKLTVSLTGLIIMLTTPWHLA